MDNSKACRAPLRPGDTEERTVGCRLTNPDTCAKNELPNLCAFVRPDGMCLAPPASWRRRFRSLTIITDTPEQQQPQQQQPQQQQQEQAPEPPR